MTDEQEWMDGFKGPEFDTMATEFHYHKLCREIDGVDDNKVLQTMLKEYIRIHLKEKEMWKRLITSPIKPINIEE